MSKMIWYQAGMVGPMSQLSQSTYCHVCCKLEKVIVEPETIEQNKPDKQMHKCIREEGHRYQLSLYKYTIFKLFFISYFIPPPLKFVIWVM